MTLFLFFIQRTKGREAKWLAQGHTAIKYQSQSFNSVFLNQSPVPFPLYCCFILSGLLIKGLPLLNNALFEWLLCAQPDSWFWEWKNKNILYPGEHRTLRRRYTLNERTRKPVSFKCYGSRTKKVQWELRGGREQFWVVARQGFIRARWSSTWDQGYQNQPTWAQISVPPLDSCFFLDNLFTLLCLSYCSYKKRVIVIESIPGIVTNICWVSNFKVLK